jgi:hypothetical protein
MARYGTAPRVVLICHEEDRVDAEGLAGWVASRLELVGIIKLREAPERLFTKVRREIRRVGLWRFLDVLAFRLYYRLKLSQADTLWAEHAVADLRRRYPASFAEVPVLVAPDPNTRAVRRFLARLRPDLMLARCKFILKPAVYGIPRFGTYVLHPGICPEYRNAHGCFWALANRDLKRVGMTLLRVDAGVDSGPVLMHASYPFDESRESPMVVQYKVVLENLEAIAAQLQAVCTGAPACVDTRGRRSATWGQPWLTAYLRWKRAARSVSRKALA